MGASLGLRPVSYEDPRACLLGLEGIALLRAFTGEHDREFAPTGT